MWSYIHGCYINEILTDLLSLEKVSAITILSHHPLRCLALDLNIPSISVRAWQVSYSPDQMRLRLQSYLSEPNERQ